MADERRSEDRKVAVLRAAVLTLGDKTHFCRIVNLSPGGMEIRLYRTAAEGSHVRVRLADDLCVSGTVVWQRSNAAGIRLDEPLEMSRLGQDASSEASRRRRLPRAAANAFGKVRVGLVSSPAVLLDISPAGAKVRTDRPISELGPALFRLPGLPPIPAQVRWVDGLHMGLMFNNCLEMHLLDAWLGEAGPSDG